MLKHGIAEDGCVVGLITVQDNTMLKHSGAIVLVKDSLITVQDNTMLKPTRKKCL